MKIEFEATDLAFRDEVRRFFEDEYPREVIAKIENGQTLSRADHILSQTALNKRGWLGVGWPAQFGGTGWTPIQRYLFDEELERRGAPNIIPMAVIYIGPIICAFGSPDQQDRWLPDILESRSLWAQGYSEPEAGSDLASLSFDARRDGDDYILNGTKIWTSGAHMADWIFLLARTSREGRKQDGISLICAELDLPGVSVRPIISIDGLHELNQVSFDNVRVPVSHRIGDEGRAWRYSNVLLKNERLSYAHIGRKKRDLETARKLAGDDRNLRHRIARAEIELGAIEVSVQRALIHGASPAAVASLKILCTEMAQEITGIFLTISGDYAAPFFDRTHANWYGEMPAITRWAAPAAADYFFERAQTIYGGTTEIQKNLAWRAIGAGSL
jgi:alkylation response protein AidB-like acyl-CoA dehydrogenase